MHKEIQLIEFAVPRYNGIMFLTSHSLQQGTSEEALGSLHDDHIRVCLYIAHGEHLSERILSEKAEGRGRFWYM